jgi:membrane protease YdiL (CAAX protease family)
VEPDGTSSSPAPGWYADPFGRARYRWWDGEAWTEQARDAADEPAEEAEPGLPGLGVAAVGLVASGALAVGIAAWLSAAGDPGGRPAALVLSELGLWGALVSSCVFVSRRRGTGSLVRDYAFRFRWIDLGFGLAGSIVGRVLAGMAVAPIPFPSKSLRDADRTILSGDATHGAMAWTVVILVTCVGAPLIEELFFRGLVQTRLVGRFGPVIGIVAASVVFGSAHLLSWAGPESLAYAWAVAFGGLVLGTIRHLTGRLGPGIVAHALFNLQAVLVAAWLG